MIPRTLTITAVLTMLFLCPPAAADQGAALEQEPLVRAMRDELARASSLKLPGVAAPYYLAYRVTEVRQASCGAEFGGTYMRNKRHSRLLNVDLRVGDRKMDNSAFFSPSALSFPTSLPLDDDYLALRRKIWLATDKAYKQAVDTLQKKRSILSNLQRDDAEVGDFSTEPAHRTVSMAAAPAVIGVERCLALVRPLSELAWQFNEVDEVGVRLFVTTIQRTMVTSEGTVHREARRTVKWSAVAEARAEDGMPLEHGVAVVVPAVEDLPPAHQLEQRVRTMLQQITELRRAPVLGSYSGPVLFEGPAAAQLLQYLLTPHLSGTPGMYSPVGKRLESNQLFGRLGKPVLPAGVSLVDDPTLKRFGKTPLVGAYLADDEGVPSRRVELVKQGKLQTLLMSRAPRKDLTRSTGHGRASPLGMLRARISNLVFSDRRGASDKQLKQRLKALARKAGEGQGALVIRLLENPGGARGGAFGFLSRMFGRKEEFPVPLLAYRVSADGKEKPVRGVKLLSLQVGALRDLVSGRRQEVYSITRNGGMASRGFSDGMPASIVTPALLLPRVEVGEQKVRRLQPHPLPRPGRGGK